MEYPVVVCMDTEVYPQNDAGPALEKSAEYPLIREYTCACGEVHFDVGLKFNYSSIRCRNIKCREVLPQGTQWCNSARFKKRE